MNNDLASIALQVAATLSTIACAWTTASKSLSAPVLGIISNIFWLTLEIYLQLWFLVPVPVVMTVLHVRVYARWRDAEDRDYIDQRLAAMTSEQLREDHP